MVIYLHRNVYTPQRCENMKSMKINGRYFFAAVKKRQVSFTEKMKNNALEKDIFLLLTYFFEVWSNIR